LNEDGIVRFLIELGVDSSEIRVKKKWVSCKCPLAPYTHSSGEDKHPSFGISINPDGLSAYYCFGCSPEGKGLGWLLHNMWLMSGEYPTEAAKAYIKYENVADEHDVFIPDDWDLERKEITPIPGFALKRFPLLQNSSNYEANRCKHYLEMTRGVPIWVQNLCGVRHSPEHQALVFPLTDVNGDVYCLRVRSRKEKRIWTATAEWMEIPNYHFSTVHDIGAWFGMHLIDWSRPVMLVEGEIDAMKVKSFGFFNVIASATSSVSEKQLQALAGGTYIAGYDADESGKKATKRIAKYLGNKATIFSADWSIIKKSDGKPCKDAGDLEDESQLNRVLDALILI
jgi:5S rRNA maturation endonuclease (ribonuclease M5)